MEICQPGGRQFTWKEASLLLPLVRNIYEKHEKVVKRALENQRFFMKSKASEERIKECDTIVGKELSKAAVKIHKLGVKVLGNGFFGFDSGVFYWSWRYPEDGINHYHGYAADPAIHRRKITIFSNKDVV